MKRFFIVACLFLGTYPTYAEQCAKYVITERVCQTIDGFGASDAWSMQSVGLWPEKKREKVADWLFSQNYDEYGAPEGIGLSMWRFNVGAGSHEQGNDSKINAGTRTECFLNKEGNYDWNKQQGQRNIMKMAKERGCRTFIAFLNSPPVHFTKNGLATNIGGDDSFNLREDMYERFAGFIADVVQELEKNDNIRLNYVSPVNEPDGYWNWNDSRQEGSPATKVEIARAARILNKEFVTRGIDTHIIIPESSDYRCMMSNHMTDHQRGFLIRSFFDPDSTDTYIGNLSNVKRIMAAHSYWTNTPLEALSGYRRQLADTLKKYNVEYWQSETCLMSNDEEVGGALNFDNTINSALYTARIMHHDLVMANARSWQWWRGAGGEIKNVKGDFKDGLLCVKFSKPNPDSTYKEDGTVSDSKLLWAVGNYSLFIRPGAKRLEIDAYDTDRKLIEGGDTDPIGVMCSAYRNTDNKIVIVAINYSETTKQFSIAMGNGFRGNLTAYRTSSVTDENLKPVGHYAIDGPIVLPKRSVTTFVCNPVK